MSLVLYKTKYFLSLLFFLLKLLILFAFVSVFAYLLLQLHLHSIVAKLFLSQINVLNLCKWLCLLQINTDSLSWRMNRMFVWVFAGGPVRGGASAEAEGGVVRPDPRPQPAC